MCLLLFVYFINMMIHNAERHWGYAMLPVGKFKWGDLNPIHTTAFHVVLVPETKHY